MRKAILLGAAGRDFHDFNVYFRDNPAYEVVAFTAAQIPFIEHRTYPPELTGARYPQGIPIHPEVELGELIHWHRATDVFFCYSDVTHDQVMHLASLALRHGASFSLLGPRDTMLESRLPVVAVLGARTGAGKSTVARHLWKGLSEAGFKPAVVRHPMPYGRLSRTVERYATIEDVTGPGITVEEMEEYQQHVDQGAVVYAGGDYRLVLERAEAEGDVILWDGGNNDMPFYRPTATVTVTDPLRPGEEDRYFPGEVNVRGADIIVVGKVNAAPPDAVDAAVKAVARLNPAAQAVLMESVESVDRPQLVRGKRVLVVEDGPSVTHGGMKEAVGARAARQLGATLVDPRGYAVGSLADAYRRHPHLGPVLPALGYSPDQLHELEQSINRVPCDTVVLGTPAALDRVIRIAKPVAMVRFEARDVSPPSLLERVLPYLRSR